MTLFRLVSLAVIAVISGPLCAEDRNEDEDAAPEGWVAKAPREEIRPHFSYDSAGGPNGNGSFVIKADDREGLIGSWEKTLPIEGGHYYRFSCYRRAMGVKSPRRVAVARVLWQDDKGQKVLHDEPAFSSYRPGERPQAEPEYPADGEPLPSGWCEVAGVFRAPSSATRAVIELWYQWEPSGEVQWSGVSLQQTSPPAPRSVRVATVHYQPRPGKTPKDKREQFGPFIEEAAKQKVELVVLPETLTYYGTGKTFAECAEPVPGPSTQYFGELAKQHDLYIVAGLVEREKHLIYNVAVLLGPDGEVVGKYRKVTLPRSEIEGGITPGDDYPVFETRFGKLGMMVCYDGFFPEVARELSNRGAEVIAWPVWGCNPMLAAARANENHVYLISSTYSDTTANWMISGIYGRDGKVLAQASKWGTIAIADAELKDPIHWHSLGDFKAQLPRHRPVAIAEKE
jgi:predicted amidohydrolase